MLKKLFVFLLTTVFSILACSCRGDSGDSVALLNDSITKEDFANGGTKTADMDDTDINFVVNGTTEYKIVIEDGVLDRVKLAAKDLSKYVQEATGAVLPIVKESSVAYTSAGKYIVFGCESIQALAGLSELTEYVGSSGYKIVQADNSVFVQAEDIFGMSNAAYAILEYQLGWRIFSKDVITYNSSRNVKLKAFDIVEIPSYEFGMNTNKLDDDTIRRFRLISQWDVFATINGEICHTFLAYIPIDTYGEDHEGWFNLQRTQLCLTARGDADEYAALVETMAARVADNFIARPMAKATIIGQMDAALDCGCEACNAEKQHYGTVSGAYVKFMNDVSDKLAEIFEEKGIERDVDLLFFAYQDSVAAPVVDDGNGGYVPVDDSVVCRDNVAVYYTPMYANYCDSFYDDANNAYRDEVAQWNACTDTVYTFLYGTYFWNYLLPFNNYYPRTELMKYFLEQGALNYFELGQTEQEISSTFNLLKNYLDSRFLWDVDLNYKDVVIDFFKASYGPAAYDMYLFFDSMTSYLEIQETKYQNLKNIWGDIDNQDYNIWRYGVLKEWEGMIENAFKALDPLRESDPTLYAQYCDNIDLEYLAVKYIYIEFCSSYFNEKDLLELKYSFKDVAARLKVTYVKEKGLLQAKYVDWGIA